MSGAVLKDFLAAKRLLDALDDYRLANEPRRRQACHKAVCYSRAQSSERH